MTSRYTPLIIFVAMAGVLSWRLAHPGSTAVFSQLVHREVPAIDLPLVTPPGGRLTAANFTTGKPQLINLFASWCIPCIRETPFLSQLKSEGVSITGIAIRDRPEAVAAFVGRNGNPYSRIALDRDSSAQMALGSSGVPETFVVDRHGVIVRQFIGGIDSRALPEVRRSLAEAAR